jgi:hypothetical protein
MPKFRKANNEEWAEKDREKREQEEEAARARRGWRPGPQPLRPQVRSLIPPPDRTEEPRGKSAVPASLSPQKGKGIIPDQDTVMCGKECPRCKDRKEPANKMGRCTLRLRNVGGRSEAHKGNCHFSCGCALRDAVDTSRRAGEILSELLPPRHENRQGGPNDRDKKR